MDKNIYGVSVTCAEMIKCFKYSCFTIIGVYFKCTKDDYPLSLQTIIFNIA